MKLSIKALPLRPLLLAAVVMMASAASRPAEADARADALLARVARTYRAAASLSMSITNTTGRGDQQVVTSGTVTLRRPNLARVVMSTPRTMSVLSDGKFIYTLLPDDLYTKVPVGRGRMDPVEISGGLPTSLFFGHDNYGLSRLSDVHLRRDYSGKETVAGVSCDVVTLTERAPAPHAIKLYITAAGLVIRSASTSLMRGMTVQLLSDWTDQKLNAVPPTTSFAVTLPKNARLYAPTPEH